MPSIIEQKLKNKKTEIKDINNKVENEQITPTAEERKYITEIINTISGKFKDELTNQNTDKESLDQRITAAIKREINNLGLPYESTKRLEKLAIINIIGLGPIQQYLDDPEVTEIIVQRFDNICIEKKGVVSSVTAAFTDEENLKNVISRILQPVGREVNISMPIVDAHLEDGSRICATIPPVSPKGSTLTIRKFNNAMMTAEKYIELRSLSPKILNFLRLCVLGKVSIYVSGGTGTGKTTFLNMLSSFLPENELIITIEDTLELQLHQNNVRSMETRQIVNGDMENIDMAALVKASLRMRPDRIIVGETRDGAVVSLLSAMSTGHEGSMSTGHANSPENLVNVRIPTMMEMDKSTSFSERAQALMISEAIQLIVQLRRIPGGRRVVSEICEIDGVDSETGRVKLRQIFKYNFETDAYDYVNYPENIVRHVSYHEVTMDESIFK